MDLGYGLFMAEAEGYLDTCESNIENIIKEVRRAPEPTLSETAFRRICSKHNMSADTLSSRELRNIMAAIK